MKTITLTMALICGLTICSCSNRNKPARTGEVYEEDVVVTMPVEKSPTRSGMNLSDSLKMDANAGSIVNDRYSGLLPAADGPGIEYDLLLIRQDRNNHGVYELVMTYIEGDNNGGDLSFIENGRYETFRGKGANADYSYIRLTPFSNGGDTFFIIENNGNLTLVNAELQRADSQLNYTLQKRN